jgi:hypothetical protein
MLCFQVPQTAGCQELMSKIRRRIKSRAEEKSVYYNFDFSRESPASLPSPHASAPSSEGGGEGSRDRARFIWEHCEKTREDDDDSTSSVQDAGSQLPKSDARRRRSPRSSISTEVSKKKPGLRSASREASRGVEVQTPKRLPSRRCPTLPSSRLTKRKKCIKKIKNGPCTPHKH